MLSITSKISFVVSNALYTLFFSREQNLHSICPDGHSVRSSLARWTFEVLRQGRREGVSSETRAAGDPLQCGHEILPAEELYGRREALDLAEKLR